MALSVLSLVVRLILSDYCALRSSHCISRVSKIVPNSVFRFSTVISNTIDV